MSVAMAGNVALKPTRGWSLSPAASQTVWSAVAVLDKAMFSTTGWFAIGPDNKRLAGVVIPSFDAGLRLIDETVGNVALVGRLRPGMVAVDIDVPGDRGWSIAEQITSWCEQRLIWHLLRPSGGADGRTHVFAAAGAREDDLKALVASIRSQLRLGANLVGVRNTVRVLSSPHRSTGRRTLPLGIRSVSAVRVTLGLLESSLRLAPTTLPRRRRRTGRGSRAARTPLVPRSRPRTPLRPEWAHWLKTGERPSLGGDDQTRSPYELAATTAMVRAGHTVDTAWDLIMDAHPDAMSKARDDRGWWINWIWNHVVRATEHETGGQVDERVAAALDAAWYCLQERLWSLSPRKRPAVWAVAVALFDRIRREGKLQVPCPQRNLLLDTGIKDRTTISNALDDLDGHVGIVHRETFDRLDPYTSFEFEVLMPPPDEAGVLLNPPPVLTSPALPQKELHGWGLRSQMLRSALESVTPQGLSLTQLAQAALLTDSLTAEPTMQQARTLTQELRSLAAGGWAVCDSEGRWRPAEPDPTSEATLKARAEAAEARAERTDLVSGERAEFRRKQHCQWALMRRAAVERVHARYAAWWDGLSSGERLARARAASEQFATLSPAEQAKRKHVWAARRTEAGISEADRHTAWLTSMSADELAARSQARRDWYWGRIDAQLRREFVQAWEAHRDRYEVPRAQRRRRAQRSLFEGAA